MPTTTHNTNNATSTRSASSNARTADPSVRFYGSIGLPGKPIVRQAALTHSAAGSECHTVASPWTEFSAADGGIMDVTKILQRARDCADIAQRKTGQERTKLLELADAW
jgi:hypothetical protein